MATLYDFGRQIADLKKENRYQDALAYFKQSKADFTKEEISKNEYIVSDIITCLRKSSHIDAGFQFLEIFNVTINDETSERVLSAYGWLLWSKYKDENSDSEGVIEEEFEFDEGEEPLDDGNHEHDESDLVKKIEVVIAWLLDIPNDFTQTLISNLFSIVVKCEKRKPSPNWKLINNFCSQFKPEQLSKSCSTIQVERKGQMKDLELASDFENWYAFNTNALFKLGEWEECYEVSNEALEKIDSFHYSNDIWFARRVAISNKKLGNTENTVTQFEEILKKKKEWFIQKELSEIYFEKGELEQALSLSLDAVNNFGPLEFKCDLLYLMGGIFQKKSEYDFAFKHFSLSKLVRLDKGWKIPQKLTDALDKFTNDEIPLAEFGQLKSELKKYWGGFNQKYEKKDDGKVLEGTIIKIMNDNERGKDGFLKSGNSEYYFSVSANYHLTPKIERETRVGFKIIAATGGKKERAKVVKIFE